MQQKYSENQPFSDTPLSSRGKTIIFTSLMPDKIECWNTALLKNYIDKFHSTCTEFEVEPPFEFAELKSLVFSSGIISRGGKIV